MYPLESKVERLWVKVSECVRVSGYSSFRGWRIANILRDHFAYSYNSIFRKTVNFSSELVSNAKSDKNYK